MSMAEVIDVVSELTWEDKARLVSTLSRQLVGDYSTGEIEEMIPPPMVGGEERRQRALVLFGLREKSISQARLRSRFVPQAFELACRFLPPSSSANQTGGRGHCLGQISVD